MAKPWYKTRLRCERCGAVSTSQCFFARRGRPMELCGECAKLLMPDHVLMDRRKDGENVLGKE